MHNIFGPSVFSTLDGRRQNYDLNFQKSCIRNRKQNLFNLPFCCLQFDVVAILRINLFEIVICCKIVNSSTKFKLFHEIIIIHEKFLVIFNSLRGPDRTHSRAMHP